MSVTSEYEEEREEYLIDGYKTVGSVPVGEKRVVFAIHDDPSVTERYMQCTVTPGNLISEFNGYTYDNYFEAMRGFSESITIELGRMEEMQKAIGLEDISCLTEKDVQKIDWTECIKNKVVAIREEELFDGCKDISNQLFLVDSGFGVQGNSRGSSCFGWDLYKRERTCIYRQQVLGVVPEDKLPEFAKKTLEDIRSGVLQSESSHTIKKKEEERK